MTSSQLFLGNLIMNQAAWTQFVGDNFFACVLCCRRWDTAQIKITLLSMYLGFSYGLDSDICGSVPRERSIHHLELLLLHGVSNLDGSQDGSEGFRCIWILAPTKPVQKKKCPKKVVLDLGTVWCFFVFFRWKALYFFWGATRSKMWEAGLLRFVFLFVLEDGFTFWCAISSSFYKKKNLYQKPGIFNLSVAEPYWFNNKLSQLSWNISQCQPHHHYGCWTTIHRLSRCEILLPKKRRSGMKSHFLKPHPKKVLLRVELVGFFFLNKKMHETTGLVSKDFRKENK